MKFFSREINFTSLWAKYIRSQIKKMVLSIKMMFHNTIDLLVDECAKVYAWGVDFLLKIEDVDVNMSTKEGVTPLIEACYTGNKDIVEYLIEHGANLDKEGCVYDKKTSRVVCEGTPLIVATKMGNIEIVKILIDGGADINKQYGFGKTALIYAVENRRLDVVEYLVEKWARVNIVPMDKYIALAVAVKNRDKEMAEFLLNYGANINHKLSDDKTILSIAIDNKDRALTELFIDNFVNLDVLDKEREGESK